MRSRTTPLGSIQTFLREPSASNLPKGFPRFGILRNFSAGVRTYLGYGLGLLRVTVVPVVYPKAPVGLIMDCYRRGGVAAWNQVTGEEVTQVFNVPELTLSFSGQG